MKRLKTIWMGLLLLGFAATAQAQDAVRIQVQLIAADQQAGPSDAALSALLPKLQRMPFSRFQQKGTRVVSLTAGKTVNAAVGGHDMKLTLENVEGARARMNVNWMRGQASVVNITAVTQPGSPFVCGGPREGDTTWIAVFSVQ